MELEGNLKSRNLELCIPKQDKLILFGGGVMSFTYCLIHRLARRDSF
jgi:hypothetical protein